MKTFTIDSENKIMVLDSRVEAEQVAAPGAARFSSIDELAQVTQDWPLARLVAVWNGLPGLTPVSKFTDRRTAIARIWMALQDPVESTNASHAASAKRRGRFHFFEPLIGKRCGDSCSRILLFTSSSL